jgi:hypothetical protein
MRPAISLDNVALCNDTSCARISVAAAAAGSGFWANAALVHNAMVRPASKVRSRIVRSGRSVTAFNLVTAWPAEVLHLDHAIGIGATAGARIGALVQRLSVLARRRTVQDLNREPSHSDAS